MKKNAKLYKTESIGPQVHKIKSAVINLVQILDDLLPMGKIEGEKIPSQEISDNIKKPTKVGPKFNYHHQGNTDIHIETNQYGGIFLHLITNTINYPETDFTIKTKRQDQDLFSSVEG
ncbi:hypothetical protein [Sediminicola sp. 1XM1-17]|uniref:hypothetical protein n=1 Tax=Sediminicola sp. 1XM1-17 TaxID=3127702 RepID=UPI003076DEFB